MGANGGDELSEERGRFNVLKSWVQGKWGVCVYVCPN